MNPNHDTETDMQTHSTRVWKDYVLNSGFTDISIIAHSAGGGCLSDIQSTYADTFYKQVSHIAYTDSWTIQKSDLNNE